MCRRFLINKQISYKSLGYCTPPHADRLLGYSTPVQTRLFGYGTSLRAGLSVSYSTSRIDQLCQRTKPSNFSTLPVRRFTQCMVNCTDAKQAETETTEHDSAEGKTEGDSSKLRPVVDVQTSIRYMDSKAYKITYGDALVWQPYKRNHKGSIPPEKTRKTCIRQGVISTGNPCPICRDEYLVLHPENVALLKQFIMPQTGAVLSYQKTGLCQVQHKNLLIALEQAWDLGYLDSVQPFRRYDYSEYYSQPISEMKTKTGSQ